MIAGPLRIHQHGPYWPVTIAGCAEYLRGCCAGGISRTLGCVVGRVPAQGHRWPVEDRREPKGSEGARVASFGN